MTYTIRLLAVLIPLFTLPLTPAFASTDREKQIDDILWEADVPDARRAEAREHIREREAQGGTFLSPQELRWVVRGFLAKPREQSDEAVRPMNSGNDNAKKHKCFGCEAQVLTPQGFRPLERLKPRDEIYSWDVASQRLVINYVSAVHRFDMQSIHRMRSTPTGRPLDVTAEHPFFLPAERRYVAIGEISSTQRLLAIATSSGKCESALWSPDPLFANGYAVVMTISVQEEPFNFIVEGLLVHNKPIF